MTITPNAPTIITLTPNVGQYQGALSYVPVRMSLVGDASFSQSSSSGGWQIVDRPKMPAAIQWFDRAPWVIEFEAYLDKSKTEGAEFNGSYQVLPGTGNVTLPGSHGSVEDFCAQLKLWMEPVPGLLQPPVLTVNGPVPESSAAGGDIQAWVLYNVTFNEAIRDLQSGVRIQQKVKITLYEYLPPLTDMYANFNLTPVNAVTKTAAGSGTAAQPVKSKQKKVPVLPGESFWVFLKRVNKTKDPSVIATLNNLDRSQYAAPGPYNHNADHTLIIPT